MGLIHPYTHTHTHNEIPLARMQYNILQADEHPFNRATLMNVGYVEAMKDYNWTCCIFHDVDLLPEDDRNLYTCPSQPRHMSVAMSTLKYILPYKLFFGGVGAISVEHFQVLVVVIFYIYVTYTFCVCRIKVCQRNCRIIPYEHN